MNDIKQVLGPDDVRRAVTRMAHEIIERNRGLAGVALIGLQRGGVWLADELGAEIARIDHAIPVGAIDASLYRDDIGLRPVSPGSVSDINFEIDGATVVLVDDVLFTGRTVKAALDAITDYGRPSAVQLAVLVDRGHRELPIRPDFVGKNLPTSADERVDRHRRRRHLITSPRGAAGVKHFRSIDEAGPDAIKRLLDLADHMAEVNRRPNPRCRPCAARPCATSSSRTRPGPASASKPLPSGCRPTR